MNEAPERPKLRQVIARHGLDAKKSLGQHFLLDENLTAASPARPACWKAAMWSRSGRDPAG